MNETKYCPIVNPAIVFRQEFDNWALLYEPDTGKTFGLDPASSFVWEQFNGENTKSMILKALDEACEGGIPEEASTHYDHFLKDLEKHGLIGY